VTDRAEARPFEQGRFEDLPRAHVSRIRTTTPKPEQRAPKRELERRLTFARCGQTSPVPVLLDQIAACLFDLDGVLTKTADVLAHAWKGVAGKPAPDLADMLDAS